MNSHSAAFLNIIPLNQKDAYKNLNLMSFLKSQLAAILSLANAGPKSLSAFDLLTLGSSEGPQRMGHKSTSVYQNKR